MPATLRLIEPSTPSSSTDDYELLEASSTHAWTVFDMVAPYLARAVRHADGNYTLRDIQQAVFAGRWQLWLIAKNGESFSAAGVTQVKTLPRKRVLEIIAVGGKDMKGWLHLEPQLLKIAKSLGCSDLELSGRKGLTRKLRGWRTTHYVMRKAT